MMVTQPTNTEATTMRLKIKRSDRWRPSEGELASGAIEYRMADYLRAMRIVKRLFEDEVQALVLFLGGPTDESITWTILERRRTPAK